MFRKYFPKNHLQSTKKSPIPALSTPQIPSSLTNKTTSHHIQFTNLNIKIHHQPSKFPKTQHTFLSFYIKQPLSHTQSHQQIPTIFTLFHSPLHSIKHQSPNPQPNSTLIRFYELVAFQITSDFRNSLHKQQNPIQISPLCPTPPPRPYLHLYLTSQKQNPTFIY